MLNVCKWCGKCYRGEKEKYCSTECEFKDKEYIINIIAKNIKENGKLKEIIRSIK